MSIGNKNYFNLYLLILFSFIVRIAAIHHYGDVEIELFKDIAPNHVERLLKLSKEKNMMVWFFIE